MKDLTVVIIGTDYRLEENNIEVVSTSPENLRETISNINSKYISFVNSEDNITENYFLKLSEKLNEDFDCCFINYDYVLDNKKNNKVLTNPNELKNNKPYYKDYLFAYMFKKEKLDLLLDVTDKDLFNQIVDKEFTNRVAIGDVIYYHNPNQPKLIDFIYSDVKNQITLKNVIYVASGCAGMFNGYISWVDHIGNVFSNKYDITILYDEIYEETEKRFKKHFKCIRNDIENIYLCDRLLVTYTSYFYPKNIINLDESYLFIHGNMSDYENVIKYYDDIYTHYIAVSKTSAEKAIGYYPTDDIEYVINPFQLDKERVKPHLRLTSTIRYTEVKRPERIEKMANLMTELGIPYTWEVFTDQRENTNVNGLIFRQRTSNPMPYVADSDYFVLLSDSEACSYSILEALALNTKIIVTPLGMYDELGVSNSDIATIIPFEYFDEGNEDKLKEVILKIYKEKDKKIDYQLDESLWDKYNEIFT